MMGATNQSFDGEYPCSTQNAKTWNRAIPESGYITLGTIRYGVKHSGENRSRYGNVSSAIGSPLKGATTNDDSMNSKYSGCMDCCGISGEASLTKPTARTILDGRNGRSMLPVLTSANGEQPETSAYHIRPTKLYVKGNLPESGNNLVAKNRTQSTSSSTASASPSPVLPPLVKTSTIVVSVSSTTTKSKTTKPTSTLCTTSPSAAADRLVIGSRESSPPPATCCYYSLPTKIAHPLKQSSSSAPSATSPKHTAKHVAENREQRSSFEYRSPPAIHSRKSDPRCKSLASSTAPSPTSKKPSPAGEGLLPIVVYPSYCRQNNYSSSVARASQASNASLLSSSQSNFDDRRVDSVSSGKCSPTFNNSTDWICDETIRVRHLNASATERDHHQRSYNQKHQQHQQPQPSNVQRLCANLSLVKCATHRCCQSADSTDLNATRNSSTSDSGSECPYRSSPTAPSRYVNGASEASSVSGKRSADRLVQPDRGCGGGDPSINISGESQKLSVQLTKNCVDFVVGGGNGSDDCCHEADANRKHDTKITQTPHDKREDVTVTATQIKYKTQTPTAPTNTKPRSSASATVRSAANVIHDADGTNDDAFNYGAAHNDDAFKFDDGDDDDDVVKTNHSDHDEAECCFGDSVASVGIVSGANAIFFDRPNYDDLSFIDSSPTHNDDVYQSNYQLSAAAEQHNNSSGIPIARNAYLDNTSPKINSVTLKSCFRNINNNHNQIYKHIGINTGEFNTDDDRPSDLAQCIQPDRVPVCPTKIRPNLEAVVEEESYIHEILAETDIRYESVPMDKRRKTLDRWQRLGFGRRSGSNPPADSPTHSSESSHKSSDKTERLKELTEKLKGCRSSQNPPIPPPRKPRSPNPNLSAAGSTASLAEPIPSSISHSPPTSPRAVPNSSPTHSTTLPENRGVFHDSLKAISNSFRNSSHVEHSVDDDYFAPTSAAAFRNTHPQPASDDDHDQFHDLPKMDSSVAHKSIPCRSASFSQVDYSSGKYIRSALGALKASIMKHKEPSVVDSANLTLPRKKECNSSYHSTEDIEANLDIADKADKYIFLTDNQNRRSIQSSAAPEMGLSETETEAPINPLVIVNASEMTLDTLCEEELHLQQAIEQDEYLQTATTCLIPVPVYECVVRDWNFPQETDSPWIAANEVDDQLIEVNASMNQGDSNVLPADDFSDAPQPLSVGELKCMGPIYDVPCELNSKDSGYCCEDPVVLEQIAPTDEPRTGNERNKFERSNTWNGCVDSEQVPEISVTSGSIFDLQSTIVPEDTQDDSVQQRLSTEFVEVRKRQSNEAKYDKPVDSSQTSLDSFNPNPGEDRRKIDKSKRRKGMYIQWPVLDKQKSFDSVDWNPGSVLPVASLWQCDPKQPLITSSCLPEPSAGHLSSTNSVFLMCKSPETPLSESFDPSTPESECGGRPVWPKGERRKSLTCQSSEEKEEPVSVSASPSIRSYNKMNYLRSDSISDNESDRQLRERCSQSPAPNDQDLKRYSKRPVRGPYGQMLEAEMNKQGKPLYSEILEELNKADSSLQSKESPDDVTRPPTQTRQNHGYLNPIAACHIRASSTPVHMDPARKEIVANHRRFPSCIDGSTDLKKEFKKMSLDSSSSIKDILRSPKKSTSLETNINAKRNSKEEFRLQPSTNPRKEDTLRNTLKATPELLAQLLKGSSEKLVTEQYQLNKQRVGIVSMSLPTAVLKCLDTRTHVVVELFNTEQSYVESLEVVVLKYLIPLKSPENAGIIDPQTVDDIFRHVPAILQLHERFLNILRNRLNAWDSLQQVGDAFLEVFSCSTVLDTYVTFVNNWNRAKEAIRSASRERPAFAKYIEMMARDHKGKLSLDNLLIKPVQKFPNYELILSRLIKHTNNEHPDQIPLQQALKLVHEILLHLNCKEREALENDQRETVLREMEAVIEGASDLVTTDRQFLQFELVSIATNGQAKDRKERGLFLFNDMIIIASVKRRTIKKLNSTGPPGVASTLDSNRYKLHTKISIEDVEIVKPKDGNLLKVLKEIDLLSDDAGKLQKLADISASLRCPHHALEDNIKELQRDIQRQLNDRQTNDIQLCMMELTMNLPTDTQNMSVLFPKPDKKTQWERGLIEAKKTMALLRCHPTPQFINYVPIRKTRSGLQLTCAAPTLGGHKEVWLCNSDGYVGQVCMLNLDQEPNVTSCNSVSNSRILCIASVPNSRNAHLVGCSVTIDDVVNALPPTGYPQVSSSDDESDPDPPRISTQSPSTSGSEQLRDLQTMLDDMDDQPSTMWLGLEDGYVHIYNGTINVRSKNNSKIKILHPYSVFGITYFNNKVFVSLASGDLYVYKREHGKWNIVSPQILKVAGKESPISRMLCVNGNLWCSIKGTIRIVDIANLTIVNEIEVSSDLMIGDMAFLGDSVWISVRPSSTILCYRAQNFELMHKVNLSEQVAKMLSGCNDIIKQHKDACMKITALMACKDSLWVGTSSGVLLTVHKPANKPVVTAIQNGHTGHVRVLACVPKEVAAGGAETTSVAKRSFDATKPSAPTTDATSYYVISGGDGYEDFLKDDTNPVSEVAGREDSTNHLLVWEV